MKPESPADQEFHQLNLEHLKWVKKEECRLAKHAFTSYPVHAVRPSISRSFDPRDPDTDISNDQAEVAPSICDEIYLLETRWNGLLTYETQSDIDVLLYRNREMITNISKESFVAAMRMAELVSISSPTEPSTSTRQHSSTNKKVRIIIHSSDETQIYGPFLPSAEVPDYSEFTVYITGRMSEQDPDFQVPLSHRLRREYREYSVDEPEYPVYDLPEKPPSSEPEYLMPSLNTRKEMLRLRHEIGDRPISYLLNMERRYPLADLGCHEYRGRDTVLTRCRLKYAPRTNPGLTEAWREVGSRGWIPDWMKELHNRSLEN